jgi:ribonucleoside-diphosphate reductase alpha chain
MVSINTDSTIRNNMNIDYSRDSLFDELGIKRLRDSYMRPEETSPQDRFAYVSKAFASNEEHAQRLYDYSSKHWLSYSTPILSFGRNKRGMPISCFLNYLDDTAEGLVSNLSETNWLSMMGGGVGIHVGIRGSDEKSVGVMPHLKVYDASSLAYKQGTTRRGSYAAYLDVSHPDIIQFLEMRKPTGDQNMRTLNLNHAINISDKFMQVIENCMVDPTFDDSWDLVQPNSGKVVETVSAKDLWMRILEMRMQTGEPYLWFNDTANRALPEYQKKLGLSIKGSNLCSEISLATDKNRTAVCCLSSVNLEYYDDWKDNKLFLRDVLEMLDNVLQYFIDNAPDSISRARYSAWRERSVGVGALGFHALLQKKGIAFEGVMAKSLNNRIFKHIRTELDAANEQLAYERDPCPDAKEAGVMKRLTHVMAVAPNASSSIIMGNTSPSIEPYAANAYRQDTTSGAYLTKNRFLDAIIKKESESQSASWYDDTWASITANDGSVQHLDWMDENTKFVFKTAAELDQRWVIEHAADRQQYIDQAQSVNLFFRPDVNIKYLHAVHFMAYKQGLKSLYYCRSSKLRKADKVGQRIERKRIEEEINLEALVQGSECLSCEG